MLLRVQISMANTSAWKVNGVYLQASSCSIYKKATYEPKTSFIKINSLHYKSFLPNIFYQKTFISTCHNTNNRNYYNFNDFVLQFFLSDYALIQYLEKILVFLAVSITISINIQYENKRLNSQKEVRLCVLLLCQHKNMVFSKHLFMKKVLS